MPSGYTSRLCEGEQPFEEFVLQCARAFGACVMQRDAPIDELPTHNERDSYYTNALAAAKRTLSNMKKMSATRREAFGQREIAEQLNLCNTRIAEIQAVAARIKKMVAQVEQWVPNP